MKISSHSGVHHMAGGFKAKKHAEKAPSTSTASDNPPSNTSNAVNTVTSGAQLSFQTRLAASAIDQSAAS